MGGVDRALLGISGVIVCTFQSFIDRKRDIENGEIYSAFH
jgi:hypothetical protein